MSPSLSSPPAAANLRAAVRPILRATLRRPGRLYQPLFIGPVSDPEAIEAELQIIASLEGVPVYFARNDADGAKPAIAGTAALVVTAEEAALWVQRGVDAIPSPVQLIVIGADPVESLDEQLQAWLAGGLVFDPRPYVRATGQEWTMGPAIARAARDPGRVQNPLLLVAPASIIPVVASEASLRLEAAGVRQVLPSALPADWATTARRVAPGGAVVVEAAAITAPAELNALRDMLMATVARGIQAVVVLDTETQRALQADPAWATTLAARAGSVVVAADSGKRASADAARAARLDAYESWPAAPDLMLGVPHIAPAPDRVLNGQAAGEDVAGALSLGSTLQMVTMQAMTGRLVVFDLGRLGAIEIVRGRIVHARNLADRWTPLTLATARAMAGELDATTESVAAALVFDRVCHMGTWRDARFTFVRTSGPSDVPAAELVDIPTNDVLLEIASRIDETPRRFARVGGLGRVWQRGASPLPPNAVSAIAERLWAALDAHQTTQQLAWQLGLLDEEALDAILELAELQLITSCGDRSIDDASTSVHRVATQLLAWGLALEARDVLTAASQSGQLTSEGARLLGHLAVQTDPDLAATLFRDVLEATTQAGVDGLDVRFNLALLEVRGRQVAAPDAWRALLEALQSRNGEALPTARHYAICAELAIRAGDRTSANRMLDGVRAFPGADTERLATALQPTLSLL